MRGINQVCLDVRWDQDKLFLFHNGTLLIVIPLLYWLQTASRMEAHSAMQRLRSSIQSE